MLPKRARSNSVKRVSKVMAAYFWREHKYHWLRYEEISLGVNLAGRVFSRYDHLDLL